jgi:hypothetical protein|tara:strand:- start:3170 stop:3604 length:435 start_codon:yes stop_codon:yes gene_type:complete
MVLVNEAKKKFPKYDFYLVGSMARLNPRPNDIDIGIIPNKGKVQLKEWEKVLEFFEGKHIDGLRVDAQIVPAYRKLFHYSGDTIRKLSNSKIYRYVYHTDVPASRLNIQYSRACGNLWRKKVRVVSDKYRARGLMGMEFTNIKL